MSADLDADAVANLTKKLQVWAIVSDRLTLLELLSGEKTIGEYLEYWTRRTQHDLETGRAELEGEAKQKEPNNYTIQRLTHDMKEHLECIERIEKARRRFTP